MVWIGLLLLKHMLVSIKQIKQNTFDLIGALNLLGVQAASFNG